MTRFLHRPGSRTEVICSDLDSTIADTRPRRHLCPTVDPGRTWSEYAMACTRDQPIPGTVRLLRMLHAAGYGIHIITNRPECSRKLSVAWLDTHKVPFDSLYMRPDDMEMDNKIKVDYVALLRESGYEPLLFLEDWPTTAAEIEKTGVPVFCVNPRYGKSERAQFVTEGHVVSQFGVAPAGVGKARS